MIAVEKTYEQGLKDGYAKREEDLMNVKNLTLSKAAIQQEVSKFYGIPWSMIESKNKDNEVVMARHTYCYLMFKLLDLTLPQVANFVGYKHHTSVMHAVGKIEDYMDTEPETKNRILHLLNKLSNVRSSS